MHFGEKESLYSHPRPAKVVSGLVLAGLLAFGVFGALVGAALGAAYYVGKLFCGA